MRGTLSVTRIRASTTPRIGRLQTYTVSAQWASHPNRALNATYTVHHSSGSTDVVVNQMQQGGEFISLGDFVGPTKVVLSDVGALGYVIADAVQATMIAPPPLPSGQAYITHFQAYGPDPSNNRTISRFRITNISDSESSIAVKLFDLNGNLYIDGDDDPNAGLVRVTVVDSVFSASYDEDADGATVRFNLSPGGSAQVRIGGVSGTTNRQGYGLIQWEKQSGSDSKSLIASGWVEDNFYDGEFAIVINGGLPF